MCGEGVFIPRIVCNGGFGNFAKPVNQKCDGNQITKFENNLSLLGYFLLKSAHRNVLHGKTFRVKMLIWAERDKA